MQKIKNRQNTKEVHGGIRLMKKNVMSLKATVNNIAKKSKVSAQSVLQTYMLERLLERISVSKYKDNFILKEEC